MMGVYVFWKSINKDRTFCFIICRLLFYSLNISKINVFNNLLSFSVYKILTDVMDVFYHATGFFKNFSNRRFPCRLTFFYISTGKLKSPTLIFLYHPFSTIVTNRKNVFWRSEERR